jgi:hypothetical protein
MTLASKTTFAVKPIAIWRQWRAFAARDARLTDSRRPSIDRQDRRGTRLVNCRHRLEDVSYCEGLQTPALTSVSTPTAAGVCKPSQQRIPALHTGSEMLKSAGQSPRRMKCPPKTTHGRSRCDGGRRSLRFGSRSVRLNACELGHLGPFLCARSADRRTMRHGGGTQFVISTSSFFNCLIWTS